MRAATVQQFTEEITQVISIHAAHAGSDLISKKRTCILIIFQSTLPMRAATILDDGAWKKVKISIHAAHAGSDLFFFLEGKMEKISIHAAHAGSDGNR